MAQAVLNALDCPDGELSVVVVDDPHITKLNREYLHRDGPTNVIAFPMREGDFGHINPQMVGDVVISADTAHREGAAVGMSMNARFQELLVHGILHLFGYDHELDCQEALRMEQKSRELLVLLQQQVL
jgi:probable rRNA maturation factor